MLYYTRICTYIYPKVPVRFYPKGIKSKKTSEQQLATVK